MSDRAQSSLGAALRKLRGPMTQLALAAALGRASSGGKPPSNSAISLWERDEAQPGDHWLDAYAKVFGSSPVEGLSLPDVPGDVTDPEDALRAYLRVLRNRVDDDALATTDDPAKGFWRFGDQRLVTVAGTPMYPRWVQRVAYADPYHPNFIKSLRNGDMDATVNLAVHLTGSNPGADVEYLTHDQLELRHYLGHLVVLGGADTSLYDMGQDVAPDRQRSRSELTRYLSELKLPLFARLPHKGDDEFDTEFVVRTDDAGHPSVDGSHEEVHRPVFEEYAIGDDHVEREEIHGYPQITNDVALLLRVVNPSNSATTLTICSGVFSRGTLGAVLALTDPGIGPANEAVLRREFGRDGADLSGFWVLFHVPVRRTGDGAVTLPPDLSRAILTGGRLP